MCLRVWFLLWLFGCFVFVFCCGFACLFVCFDCILLELLTCNSWDSILFVILDMTIMLPWSLFVVNTFVFVCCYVVVVAVWLFDLIFDWWLWFDWFVYDLWLFLILLCIWICYFDFGVFVLFLLFLFSNSVDLLICSWV